MNEPQSTADAAHADIGLVCALAIEVNPLLDRCSRVRKYTGGKFTFRGGRYDDIRIAVVQAGMGFANARRASRAFNNKNFMSSLSNKWLEPKWATIRIYS